MASQKCLIRIEQYYRDPTKWVCYTFDIPPAWLPKIHPVEIGVDNYSFLGRDRKFGYNNNSGKQLFNSRREAISCLKNVCKTERPRNHPDSNFRFRTNFFITGLKNA